MFGILLSAGFSILSWLVRSILVKFAVFFGLYFVTTEFMAYVIPAILPSTDGLFSSLGSLPSSMVYFLNVFQFPLGLSMVLSAYLTRFIIRRIPLIG